MLSLVSLCSAVFQGSIPLQMQFSSMIQSNLDPPLNTKSVYSYVMELRAKFGNFWDPGVWFGKFCSPPE
jgi:hypothetical protein